MNKKSSEITETEHNEWIKSLVDEMIEDYNEETEIEKLEREIEHHNITIEMHRVRLAECKVKLDELKKLGGKNNDETRRS